MNLFWPIVLEDYSQNIEDVVESISTDDVGECILGDTPAGKGSYFRYFFIFSLIKNDFLHF